MTRPAPGDRGGRAPLPDDPVCPRCGEYLDDEGPHTAACRPRRGRPVQADALRHTFRLRCAREQIDDWIRAAEAEGVTVSEWARGVLDRAAADRARR